MNAKQKQKLRKFVKELEQIRGRHTELVSVYAPAGYELIKIIQHLQEEQGTAENIKDKTTRKSVIDSLERMIRHLRLYKKTPENGLAAFAGNIAEREGQQDIKVWSIEPPLPLKTRLYRCDQTFVLDLLKEMMDIKETYGLIILDNREANIGLLRGTLITEIASLTSAVPGKIKAGGQCNVFGTLVQCFNGEILKIENCHNSHIVKSVFFDDLSIQESNITDKWLIKKDCIYKITTSGPQLVNECSEDHLFFVSTSLGIIEKPASELRVGDYLLMPEKIDIKGKLQELKTLEYYNSFIISKEGRLLLIKKRKDNGLYQREVAKSIGLTQTAISFYELGKINSGRDELYKLCNFFGLEFSKFLKKYTVPSIYREVNVKLPVVLDADLAQFLGYFIGDGNFENERITFSEQDKQVALFYKNKFGKFFNLNVSYRFRDKKNYHQIRFTSKPLVRFIKGEFSNIKDIQNQQIPKQVLKSEDKVLAGFLRGLFDAEGYACADSVGIASINKLLIGQVLFSLLRFSIISSFIEYDNKNNPYSKKPIYKLKINDKESIINFKRFISFTSLKKTKQLNKLLTKKSAVSRARRILPLGNKVKKIIQEHGYSSKSFQLSNFFSGNETISKNVFKNSILKYVRNDRNLYKQLSIVHNYTLLPVKIRNIEVIRKPTLMIDISVKNRNFIANGLVVHNSQTRFARLREQAAHEFYKRIAEIANLEFLEIKENLKGIILGGPGPTKETFLSGAYLNNELKKKVIGTKDLSYTGEFGLHELVDKSHDLLAKEDVIKEKQLMERFFETLNKEPGKATYGKENVEKAIEYGAVDILLISETIEDEVVENLEERAQAIGAKVEIISIETREGAQLRELGGIAAILRYSLK